MARRHSVIPAYPNALYADNSPSPAIRSGDLLFVSGMVGALPDGSPEPVLEEQVRLAFRNLIGVLNSAGASFDDVVDVTVFLVDAEATFDRVVAILGEFWGTGPYPNVTAVGVTWLAGFQFEIKAIARLSENTHV